MKKLIDVHSHFLTDEYVDAAKAAGIIYPDGMPSWPNWSLDEQLDDMNRRKIDKAILSISSPGVSFASSSEAPELARNVNEFAHSLVKIHPERLGFFASLPLPDVLSASKEATRSIIELGATGVIVESNAHGQYLGDSELEPLWGELDKLNAIVFIHPTTPPDYEKTALGRPRPMLEFMFDTTRSVVDLVFSGVLQRYPHIRFIVPHSGATLSFLSDRIAMFQGIFKTGGTDWNKAMQNLWFDTAGTPFPNNLPLLAKVAGFEHLLYGSDSCWTPKIGVENQLASIDLAKAPEGFETWRDLMLMNAEKLLK